MRRTETRHTRAAGVFFRTLLIKTATRRGEVVGGGGPGRQIGEQENRGEAQHGGIYSGAKNHVQRSGTGRWRELAGLIV